MAQNVKENLKNTNQSVLFYFQDILRAHIVQSRSNSKDCQEVPDGCREMDLQDERADDGLDAKWIAGIVLG